jgi:hypothetical protein
MALSFARGLAGVPGRVRNASIVPRAAPEPGGRDAACFHNLRPAGRTRIGEFDRTALTDPPRRRRERSAGRGVVRACPAMGGVGILTPLSRAVTVGTEMTNLAHRFRIALLWTAVAAIAAASGGVLVAGSAFAGSVPQEPEQDNSEYVLDLVTNSYARAWREAWDGGDNRFRFRLGSNEVAQWFVEEELKLSASLTDRFRFRFHHARLLRYTTEQIPWDVLEFEGRVHKQLFASFYARPAFDKRVGSLGLMLQLRQAVNRYARLSVEWPGFMRNFVEHHQESSDSVLHIFTEQPVRFALDLREEITPNIWIRVTGEVIPQFGMGDEIAKTGDRIARESAQAEAAGGWIEYVVDPSRAPAHQFAFGVEADYQRERKSKGPVAYPATFAANASRAGVGGSRGWAGASRAGADEGAAPSGSRRDGVLRKTPELRFDEDLYEEMDDDTVTAWRETRAFVAPYAWVPIGERVVVNATVRFEEREISVSNDEGKAYATTNEYVVRRLGASYAFGGGRRFLVESGWAAEFRRRTVEVEQPFGGGIELSRNDIDDHRIYLAIEYRFGEANMIRLNEAFELDCEDRGQFGIHDHGFFQMIVGF